MNRANFLIAQVHIHATYICAYTNYFRGDMNRVNFSRTSSPGRVGGLESPLIPPSSMGASESEYHARTQSSMTHAGPSGARDHSVLRCVILLTVGLVFGTDLNTYT
jgi:hypothetical protein